MHSPIFFTQEGLDKLQKEYELLHVKRKSAVQELSIARDMGDRSENAAYKVARQKLSRIDSRLRCLNLTLRRAKAVEKPKSGEIGIGSTVSIHDGKQGKTYHIVGGHESDIVHGKLSSFSPIGKSLIGKKIGDIVHVHIPAGSLTLQILKIE